MTELPPQPPSEDMDESAPPELDTMPDAAEPQREYPPMPEWMLIALLLIGLVVVVLGSQVMTNSGGTGWH